jgi:hypothetical protein
MKYQEERDWLALLKAAAADGERLTKTKCLGPFLSPDDDDDGDDDDSMKNFFVISYMLACLCVNVSKETRSKII